MITLMKGDCLERMREIPDKSVDMVLTDPPYLLVGGGCVGPKNPGFSSGYKTGKVFEHNSIKFGEWAPEIKRITKDMAHVLVFCNGRHLGELLSELGKDFQFKNILTWVKNNKTPNRNYMKQTEFVAMFANGGCKGVANMSLSNVLNFQNPVGKKCHPSEKPVDMLELLVSQSTRETDTVLDLFMGSGSTGVACKNLNRNFIGIERDEKYFEIAEKRINNV